MKKERAIELLQNQLDLIDYVKQKERFSQEFNRWKRDTEIIIENVFGNTSRHCTMKLLNSDTMSLKVKSCLKIH
jgi:hypothetical protein